WLGRLAALAIERFGKDARNRGLADATRAGKQVRVMRAPRVQRIGQRAHHVLLADQLGEAPRSPFACKNLIGHADLPEDESPLCQARADKSAALSAPCTIK